MADKKLLDELTEEELLDLARGAKPDKIIDKISEAGKFIYDQGIKEGRDRISAQLVYYTYKQWKGWGNKAESRGHFFKKFNQYFSPHRSKDGMFYYLNSKPFDLSQETFWLMRKDIRFEKQKRKK